MSLISVRQGEPSQVWSRCVQFLAVAVACLVPSAALAATHIVNSTADPGVGACDSTECTLREAIAAASVGDTIVFNLPTPSTIALGSQLLITASLTLDGGTAPRLTVQGGTGYRVFEIAAGANVALRDLTVSGGDLGDGCDSIPYDPLSPCWEPVTGGGGIRNAGHLLLERCTVSGNRGTAGGGILNNGVLDMVNCTVSGNATRTGSSAFRGGGIHNGADGYDPAGILTVESCTIADNSADIEGGLFNTFAAPENATIRNTLLGDNTGSGDCGSGLTSLGHNLVEDDTGCTGLVATDITGVDPSLYLFGYAGGPTPTWIPNSNTPALDAGTSGPPADQREVPRPVGPFPDIGAFEMVILTDNAVVNSTADPGAGGCDAAECTLREAIAAVGLQGVITFDLPDNSTIVLNAANGQLLVDTSLTIEGGTAPGLTVQGGVGYRVLEIASGVNVAIRDLTVSGGDLGAGCDLIPYNPASPCWMPVTAGGGIRNAGHLLLERCTVSGNRGTAGGGILNNGILDMVNCTVSGNATRTGSSAFRGGGIHNGADGYDPAGILTVESCTIAGNDADVEGGLFNTFAAPENATIRNTLLGDNTGSGECGSGLTSLGHNLIENDTGCTGLVATDLTGVDPILQALGNWGGPTPTMAPQSNSPVVNAGTTGPPLDQRQVGRPFGAFPDIGAVELVFLYDAYIVNSTADPGTGVCDVAECTLREAIAAAAWGATITFDLPDNATIVLNSGNGQLPIAKNLTIEGGTAPGLTVQGGTGHRVFEIAAGVNVALRDLTVSGGDLGAGCDNIPYDENSPCWTPATGGGGVHNAGRLLIERCTVSGNRATAGGGILNNGVLDVVNCTIANNVTRTGNTAFRGGGVHNGADGYDPAGILTVESCTIAGNDADVEGGLFNTYAAPENATIRNTILADNTGSRECGSSLTSLGHNLVEDPTDCDGLVASDIVGLDPGLLALADNGGATQTQALGAASAARDAGSPSSPDVDQRSLPRPSGALADIGAFELQVATPDITVTPPAYDFGDVGVTHDAFQQFVVSNLGNLVLNVVATSIIGTDAAEFSVRSGGAPFTVSPGSTSNLTVEFSPSSLGAKNATLQIFCDDPDTPIVLVPLHGMGVAPPAPVPALSTTGAATMATVLLLLALLTVRRRIG